jgi:integrase
MPGHIRQRGETWELRAYVGRDPVTGRKKYLTRTFRGGKRAAEQALTKFLVEVGGGGHASQDTTVSELIKQWLELITPERSPTTARGYRWIVDTYVTPTLGAVPLSRLKPAQLDAFYAQLRDKGGAKGQPLAAATVRQVHAILRTSLNQAVKWGWLVTNPAMQATPPRIHRTEVVLPEPQDVLRLIEAADVEDPDLAVYLRTSVTTGARRGELCALKWKDVDLGERRITIAHNLVEGENGTLVEKDTKTHAARRVALDATTAAVLKAHRKRMEQRAKTCGSALADDAYVFTRSVDSTDPWVPNEVTKVFIRLRNRIGLTNVRLHDLRHFSASRLLAAGVPVRTVSGRLGHANAATTLGVYAHFVEESDRDAADALGEVLADPGAHGSPRRNRVTKPS